MTEVFVIRNQSGHFWGKSKTWVDGRDARSVMRVRHRDEAANTLFELSSKDFELRGDIVEATLNAKGEPMVEVSDIPLVAENAAAAVAEDEPAEGQVEASPQAETAGTTPADPAPGLRT